MNTAEKMLKIENKANGENKIYVTHITIRQSIFFLVLKLFAVEFFAAAFIIIFYLYLLNYDFFNGLAANIVLFNVLVFLGLVAIKTAITIYIIVSWLEEYYEITTKEVLHNKGYLFKKEKRYTLDHIGALKIQQGFLGRIFNYGTIRLYDWVKDEYIYLYLIHNPLKYARILKDLMPDADVEEELLRRHVVDTER